MALEMDLPANLTVCRVFLTNSNRQTHQNRLIISRLTKVTKNLEQLGDIGGKTTTAF
jgi:hypothetical protein